MIDSKPEPLTDSEDRELRTWFSKGPFSTLLKVLDSKVKEQQVASANEALKGTDGYIAKGNAILEEARRFQTAKDVILEIAKQEEKYSVIRIT